MSLKQKTDKLTVPQCVSCHLIWYRCGKAKVKVVPGL